MSPRKSPRTSVSDKNNGSQELQICLESGQTYRPFTDPRRIGNIDAKKARKSGTKGVPESYLCVLNPMAETPQDQKAIASASSSNVSGHELTTVETLNHRDSHVIDSNHFLSWSPSSQLPCSPVAMIPSAYCDSFPCAPCSFDFNHQYSTGTGQSPLAPTSPSYSIPDNAGSFTLDLEDPAVFAEAVETVRTMRLENVDLDLLRVDLEHDIPVPLQNRQTRVTPSALYTYPSEFLDRRL